MRIHAHAAFVDKSKNQADLDIPPILYQGGRELRRAAASLNRGLDTERNRKRHEAWAAADGSAVVCNDSTPRLHILMQHIPTQDVDALVTQLVDAAHSIAPPAPRRAAAIRDLAAASQQYAIASNAKPDDVDLLYNHALVLQEMAARYHRCNHTQTSKTSVLKKKKHLHIMNAPLLLVSPAHLRITGF